jgi:hypothetical protein
MPLGVRGKVWVYVYIYGARSGVVGSGTALQAGRSQIRFLMESLEFFIDLILVAALWSWSQLTV